MASSPPPTAIDRRFPSDRYRDSYPEESGTTCRRCPVLKRRSRSSVPLRNSAASIEAWARSRLSQKSPFSRLVHAKGRIPKWKHQSASSNGAYDPRAPICLDVRPRESETLKVAVCPYITDNIGTDRAHDTRSEQVGRGVRPYKRTKDEENHQIEVQGSPEQKRLPGRALDFIPLFGRQESSRTG